MAVFGYADGYRFRVLVEDYGGTFDLEQSVGLLNAMAEHRAWAARWAVTEDDVVVALPLEVLEALGDAGWVHWRAPLPYLDDPDLWVDEGLDGGL